eukprot:scaffold123752_cov21-Tisochrysis_lutea.AAC.3
MGAASAVSFPQLQSCREFHKSVCSPSVRGPASRKQVVTRANWGAPVEFTSAKVLRNREVTPQAHQVFVDVGSLATGYTKPGMFIQVWITSSHMDTDVQAEHVMGTS